MKPTKKYRLIPCKQFLSVSTNDLIDLRNDIVILRTDIGPNGLYKTSNCYDGIFDFIEKSLEKAKDFKPNDYVIHLSAEEVHLLYAIDKSANPLFRSELAERLADIIQNGQFQNRDCLTERCLYES